MEINFLMQDSQLVRGVPGTQGQHLNLVCNTASFYQIHITHVARQRARALSEVKIESTMYPWTWVFSLFAKIICFRK